MSTLQQFVGLKSEDSVAANGDYGLPLLAVRKDTIGSDVSLDGDYSFIQTDASGLLKTSVNNTVTIQGIQDTNTSGTITNATSIVGPLTIVQRNVLTINLYGTYTGVSCIIEVSPNNVNWFPIQCVDIGSGRTMTTWKIQDNQSVALECAVGANSYARLRATAWTSGTVNVILSSQSFAYEPLPTAIIQPMDVDYICSTVSAVNGDLFSVDTVGINQILLQITGTPTGTCTFQGSNDNITWVTINAINASTGVVITTATAIGHFAIPVRTRYIRARVTTYTTGPWNGVYRLTGIPLDPVGTTQIISGTVSANSTAVASTVLSSDVGIGVRTTTTNTFVIGAAVTASGIRHLISAASTNATILRSAAGRLYGWHLANTTAAWVYVKIHNVAVAPTAGSGIVMTIALPPNGVRGFESNLGYFFANGIGCTIVTGSADADTTPVTAGAVIADFVIG